MKYSDEGCEYFALPGGGQIHGETLPQALLRECREEVGVTIKNCALRFIREYIGKDGGSIWRDAGVHQVEFLFECELGPGEEPHVGLHTDHSQVGIAWLPTETIRSCRFYPKRLVDYLGRPFPSQVGYWGAVE